MKEKTQKNYFKHNKELMSEWDWEKNNALGIYPDELTHGSHKKVWWKCSVCGHEWEAVVHTRAKGAGCPSCAKERRKN